MPKENTLNGIFVGSLSNIVMSGLFLIYPILKFYLYYYIQYTHIIYITHTYMYTHIYTITFSLLVLLRIYYHFKFCGVYQSLPINELIYICFLCFSLIFSFCLFSPTLMLAFVLYIIVNNLYYVIIS